MFFRHRSTTIDSSFRGPSFRSLRHLCCSSSVYFLLRDRPYIGDKRLIYSRITQTILNRDMLAVFTVNSALDNGDGANTTLREAIEAANATFDEDTIRFHPDLADAVIELTQGQLSISQDTIITGTDSNNNVLNITIVADANSRSFNITGSTANVTLKGLTLTGGDVNGDGGAINATGQLTIQDSVITGNHASGKGGGVYFNEGTLTVLSTVFRDNHSGHSEANGAEGGRVQFTPQPTFFTLAA
jgi:CSLREA domain-containing protein